MPGIDMNTASVYQAIAAWHGTYASAAHLSLNLAASLATQCLYNELCGFAAAERAEHQQLQAHRDLAKLVEYPGTGWDAVHDAHTYALPKHKSAMKSGPVGALSLGSCARWVPSLLHSTSGDWLVKKLAAVERNLSFPSD